MLHGQWVFTYWFDNDVKNRNGTFNATIYQNNTILITSINNKTPKPKRGFAGHFFFSEPSEDSPNNTTICMILNHCNKRNKLLSQVMYHSTGHHYEKDQIVAMCGVLSGKERPTSLSTDALAGRWSALKVGS